MSTKIYDAYRLPADADAIGLVPALRAAVLPARLRADAQAICDRAVALVDDHGLHGDVGRMPHRTGPDGSRVPLYRPGWPWLSAIHVLAQEDRQEPASSVFHDQHRFELVVLRDPADGRLLAKAFVEDRTVREAFEQFARQAGWADWHYQNSADQPDDVDEAEWDERSRSWDRALGDDTWAARGVSIHVSPTGGGTSPSVLGIDDAEQEALEACTVPGRPERLTRMLRGALTMHLAAATSDDTVGALLNADRVVKEAVRSGHGTVGRLLERMDHLDVAVLRHMSDEPVVGHSLTEADLATAADDLAG